MVDKYTKSQEHMNNFLIIFGSKINERNNDNKLLGFLFGLNTILHLMLYRHLINYLYSTDETDSIKQECLLTHVYE